MEMLRISERNLGRDDRFVNYLWRSLCLGIVCLIKSDIGNTVMFKSYLTVIFVEKTWKLKV